MISPKFSEEGRQLSLFLEALDQPGIAIHYHMQDNLYYAILDIVDSLILASGHKHMAAFGRQLKNSLYLCASAEPIGFLEKLAVFGFPNISPEKVRPFCEFLESALLCFPDVQSEAPSPEDQFFAETLRQMIRASWRTESLELLKDSPPDTLVHDFSAHYQQVCLFFPGATHCFDDETHISWISSSRLTTDSRIPGRTGSSNFQTYGWDSCRAASGSSINGPPIETRTSSSTTRTRKTI